MPLTREQKNELVQQLQEKLEAAKSTVFADFKGLTVTEMENLRKKLRESGVTVKIAKKTLIRIASKNAGMADIPEDVMEGSVGVAFSMEDEIAAAKILHQFGKKNENLQLRGALFEGRILNRDEVKELAMIPGKEELLAKLVYLLKSPIQGFHGVLHNTLGGFVRVLNAVKEKQEQNQ